VYWFMALGVGCSRKTRIVTSPGGTEPARPTRHRRSGCRAVRREFTAQDQPA